MSSAATYYKQLPDWAKGTVAVASVATVLIVLYKGYSTIKNYLEKKRLESAVADTKGELDNLSQAGVQPSYSDIQYQLWTNAIEQCFQGWGSCEGDTIYVNLKNDADMLKLIKAFGVRTIKSGTWNPASDSTGDLAAITRDELSESQIEGINKTLEKNGIKYRF